MKNRQGIIIAAVLVVAAGIAFVAMRGKAPSTGTEGAIGAANRYATKQITSEDVTLTDADVQSFLQSDAFRAMQTNPDFRKLVMAERAETERAIGTGGRPYTLPALIDNPAGRRLVVDNRFAPNKKFITLVKNKEFVELVSTAEAKAMVGQKAYADLNRTMGAELSKAALDKNFIALMKEPRFLEFMAEVDKAQMERTGSSQAATNFAAMLEKSNTEAARAVKELQAYQALEKSAYFNKLALDRNFQTMVNNRAFTQLITSERYAGLEKSATGAWSELAANGALDELTKQQTLELIQNPAVVELISSESLQRLALDKSFTQLVAMENAGRYLEKNEVMTALAATTE